MIFFKNSRLLFKCPGAVPKVRFIHDFAGDGFGIGASAEYLCQSVDKNYLQLSYSFYNNVIELK